MRPMDPFSQTPARMSALRPKKDSGAKRFVAKAEKEGSPGKPCGPVATKKATESNAWAVRQPIGIHIHRGRRKKEATPWAQCAENAASDNTLATGWTMGCARVRAAPAKARPVFLDRRMAFFLNAKNARKRSGAEGCVFSGMNRPEALARDG